MSTQATTPEVLPPEQPATTAESIALVLPADTGLPPSLLSNIEEGFRDAFAAAEKWRTKAMAIQVTDASQIAEMKLARVIRLELKSIRVDAEKTRKRLKADILTMGKAIDGANNILLAAITPLEQHLEAQEEFAERLKEAARQKLIADRHAALVPYIDPNLPLPALDSLTDEQWTEYINNTMLLHEAKLEQARRIEAERIAREQAEAAEREKLRLENERLQKEAEEARAAAEKEAAARAAAEAKAKAEREAAEKKVAAERKAAETKAAAELAAAKAKAEAEQKAADEKARKAIEAANAAAAAARAEKEAAEAAARADAEVRARAEAAAKAKAEADAKATAEAARKAEAAPDVDKLEAFAQAIRALKVPTLTSPAGQKAQDQIAEQTAKFAVWIENLAAKL